MQGMEESLGVSIEKGDVVKVAVPNYKPKSYSMSAARRGEFDITFKAPSHKQNTHDERNATRTIAS